MRIDICVVTESHHREPDLKTVQIPGYTAVARFCRIAEGVPIKGGGLILAKTTLTIGNVRNGKGGNELVLIFLKLRNDIVIFIFP